MANAYDIVTLAEAKAALNLTATDPQQDTELAAYITAVSIRLDGLCGPVVQRSVTSESHNGGCSQILLHKYPVASVTAVTEYTDTTAQALAAETNTAKSAYDYAFDSRTGSIKRRAGNWGSWFPDGNRNVQVTYTAGRYASTTSSDPNFKQAALIMLSNLWRSDQGAGTVTFGGVAPTAGVAGGLPSITYTIPDVVIALLADELLAPRV